MIQKELVRDLVRDYLKFLETEKGIEWDQERKEKRRLYGEALSLSSLSGSDEEFEKKFRDVLKGLWALGMWRKREERINKIISKNGISNIKEWLKDLLYGEGDFAKRFDTFLKRSWGIGVASLTEILCFARPNEFMIWNSGVFLGLKRLGLERELPITQSNPLYIRGQQYLKLMSFFSRLKEDMRDLLEGRVVDYPELDFFLFYLTTRQGEELAGPAEAEPHVYEPPLDHTMVQYYLLEIGNLLGYATYVARNDKGKSVKGRTLGEIASISRLPEWLMVKYSKSEDPSRIDVIWLDSSGEELRYAFEVSHTSDMRKDLATLISISSLTSKVFVMAPNSRRDEFERLLEAKPFSSYKSKLGFIPYDTLKKLLRNLRDLRELLDPLGIRAEF